MKKSIVLFSLLGFISAGIAVPRYCPIHLINKKPDHLIKIILDEQSLVNETRPTAVNGTCFYANSREEHLLRATPLTDPDLEEWVFIKKNMLAATNHKIHIYNTGHWECNPTAGGLVSECPMKNIL